MDFSRLQQHRRLLSWLGWGVATIALVLSLLSFDLKSTVDQIARAKGSWLVVAVAANFALLPLLTQQWSRLLPKARRVRWWRLWECVTLGIAAMNTLPFGSGHAVAAGVLARRGALGVSGAVSLLALEQVCEGFAKLALLLAALAIAPLPDVLRRAAWGLAVALVVGVVLLVWLANHPVEAGRTTHWRVRWGRHLEVLREPGVFLRAAGLSLVMKVAELMAIYAVQSSLGVSLPLSTAPLILGVVTFASLISVTPGNLAVYEAAAFGIYRLLGVSAPDAIALGVVQHACFLLPIVGTGYALTAWRAIVASRSPLADPT